MRASRARADAGVTLFNSTTGSEPGSRGLDVHVVRSAAEVAISQGGGSVLSWIRVPGDATASTRVLRCTVQGHVSGSLGTDLSIALERPVSVDVEPARDGVVTVGIAVANVPYTASRVVSRWMWTAIGVGVALGCVVTMGLDAALSVA